MFGAWKSSNSDQLFQKLTLFSLKLEKIWVAFKPQSLKTQPAIAKLEIKWGERKKDNWNWPAKFEVSSYFQICLPISTLHTSSTFLPWTPPFLPFWKAKRKRNQLTFWTVVVRSKQSWMILFFIDEKSAIPVNGVLQQEKIPLRLKGPVFSYPTLSVRNSMRELCHSHKRETQFYNIYSWLHSSAPSLRQNLWMLSPVVSKFREQNQKKLPIFQTTLLSAACSSQITLTVF